jgi:hypothetical protein
MATKDVQTRWPDGTEAELHTPLSVQVEQRRNQAPKPGTAVDDVVVGEDGIASVTADAGDYVLAAYVNPSTREAQRVAVDGTAGDYTLTFDGDTTAAIAFDATAAAVETELAGLTGIGTGNVQVSGGPGDSGATTPYVVEFINDLGGVDVSALTADDTGLTGGGAAVTITTIATAAPAASSWQYLACTVDA